MFRAFKAEVCRFVGHKLFAMVFMSKVFIVVVNCNSGNSGISCISGFSGFSGNSGNSGEIDASQFLRFITSATLL